MIKRTIKIILTPVFFMIVLYADINNIEKSKDNDILLKKAIKYINGDSIGKNYKKATDILTPLCKKKLVSACYLLGSVYANGKYGIKKDINQSIQYRGLACNYGVSNACMVVAKELFKKDEDKKAIDYIKKACDYNASKSCQFLGLYYEGRGKQQDYNKSMFFHNKACNLNNALSCYSQATFYLKGLGVKKDYKEAVKLFKKSSILGNDLAPAMLDVLKDKAIQENKKEKL